MSDSVNLQPPASEGLSLTSYPPSRNSWKTTGLKVLTMQWIRHLIYICRRLPTIALHNSLAPPPTVPSSPARKYLAQKSTQLYIRRATCSKDSSPIQPSVSGRANRGWPFQRGRTGLPPTLQKQARAGLPLRRAARATHHKSSVSRAALMY